MDLGGIAAGLFFAAYIVIIIGVLIYTLLLTRRFVSAHERIAGAVERFVDRAGAPAPAVEENSTGERPA